MQGKHDISLWVYKTKRPEDRYFREGKRDTNKTPTDKKNPKFFLLRFKKINYRCLIAFLFLKALENPIETEFLLLLFCQIKSALSPLILSSARIS